MTSAISEMSDAELEAAARDAWARSFKDGTTANPALLLAGMQIDARVTFSPIAWQQVRESAAYCDEPVPVESSVV